MKRLKEWLLKEHCLGVKRTHKNTDRCRYIQRKGDIMKYKVIYKAFEEYKTVFFDSLKQAYTFTEAMDGIVLGGKK